MRVGQILYVATRRAWRAWLTKHHTKAREVWLVYYKKPSGKPRIPYSDAVEEALCFGWIDSILKPIDADCYTQRFSPRRTGSKLSPMNRERVRRLIAARRMTKAGLDSLRHVFDHRAIAQENLRWRVPVDILRRIKRDRATWTHFQRFPESYKRIRIGWIEGARKRRAVFEQRLRYFLKMTAQNKRFGMVQ